MADASTTAPRRTRTRSEGFKYDKAIIAKRVQRFYDEDLRIWADEREARLQRYAKFRLWKEGKDWPWENSSDIALPDMMEKSLHLQDVLHNAVMAQTPPVGAKALVKGDKSKESTVDNLIAHQVFAEQPGELIVGELTESFVNDGTFTAYIPWVKEKREAVDLRVFNPIPPQMNPLDYFRSTLAQAYSDAAFVPTGDGWDWKVIPRDETKEPFGVSFYTRDDGMVEMTAERDMEVYNGPRITPLDWAEVLHPARAANLQMPGPSNPHGASHVILVDHNVTVGEVKRLAKSGYYEISDDDLAKLDATSPDTKNQESERQKDTLQGSAIEPQANRPETASHQLVTRLICFDSYDIDGDGLDEDVVWWVLKGPDIVVRARRLTEQFPVSPPRRPFAEASFIPVSGRRKGISLLEMMEGLHDAMKMAFDQMVDGGTISITPFGFYRPSSTMKPETIRYWPGDLYPLSDPKNDIYFPQITNQGQVFAVNLLTLLSQQEERLTTIGDVQLGRVPQGKSSALRTAAAFQLLQGQGEARPERILRRFFIGLCEVWNQIHELNRVFLPKEKQIRILGVLKPGEDPYQTITARSEIDGRFQFGFSANVLNTSKAALQAALDHLAGLFINPLTIQLGIVDGERAFQLLRDLANAYGQDRDKYLKPPTPLSTATPLFAEDALSLILRGEVPDGRPAEAGGAQEHLQKIIELTRADDFGHFNQGQVGVLKAWLVKVSQLAQAEIQLQRTVQAAAQFQAAQQGGGQPGAPLQNPPQLPQAPMMNGPGEQLAGGEPGTAGGPQQ
ncbi:MAG: portal protein [Sciscionella sp.]